MITIKEVIKKIVKDLNAYPLNVDNNRIPSYPYITYNILNALTDDNFTGVMGEIEEDDMVLDTHTTQPNYILSITSYGNSQFQALDEIEKAWDYFKHTGYDELVKAGGAVVKQTDIINRSILLSDNYQYRYGFDVKIRRLKTIKKKEHWIEKSDVDMEGLD